MSEHRTLRSRLEQIIGAAMAEAARQGPWPSHGPSPAELVTSLVLAELRELDDKARMAGGRSLLAGDIGPEVDEADAATLEAYASDFDEAWRVAIDAIREGEG